MRILDRRQVQWGERRDHELLTVGFLDQFVPALSKFANLLLAGILRRRQKVLAVGGKLLEMLYFLLAVEHLPTLNAQDFAIALLLDQVELVDERIPFGRVALDELSLCRPLGAWLLHQTRLAAARIVMDGLACFGRLLSAAVQGPAATSGATPASDFRHFWRLLHSEHLFRELVRFVCIVGTFEALVNQRLILLVIHVSVFFNEVNLFLTIVDYSKFI